ncbi:MAG: PQQ-binding-like beta-propeller repeat protein, partial [Verrucomicrobiales bacterium]|nr:PQQ-binding-like beta-propeller repeat protein [Verrucomicrobiales bacterium]
EKRWQSRGRLEAVHPLQNLATPSCAVDGERVVAWFGTGQVVCLDTAGEVQWERHLGEELHEFRLKWGHSSSPVVDRGMVYLLCDHDPAACFLVLDVGTGDEVWKVERGKGLRSYSTPVLADVGGRRQVVVNSNPGMDGYDAATGELVWSWKEFCKVPVPNPTVVDGVMTASRGYGNGPVMVLDLNGLEGRADEGAVEWRWGSKAPYVSSPLVAGELVYLSGENGQVYCVEGASGDLVWAEKLGTCFWSSPVGAGGLVYLLDENGEVVVLREGRELEVVGRNPMPGEARGSMVVDGGRVLVRTTAGLFCIKG